MGCDGSGSITSGSQSATLSNEYTTPQLRTDAETALAAASWSAYSPFGSQASEVVLSSDELTITLTQGRVRVIFSAALPAGASLTWDVLTNGVVTGSGGASGLGGLTQYDAPAAPLPASYFGYALLTNFVLTCP